VLANITKTIKNPLEILVIDINKYKYAKKRNENGKKHKNNVKNKIL
jgi:hypothetical protein